MTKSEADKLVKKHGSIRKAATAVGCDRKTIARALARSEQGKVVHAKKQCRSIGDFRALYNKDFIIPKRIKEALASLGNGWLYEVEFAKDAGVSMNDLGNYRDQFADYIVQLKESRRVWAGKPSVAKTLRDML